MNQGISTLIASLSAAFVIGCNASTRTSSSPTTKIDDSNRSEATMAAPAPSRAAPRDEPPPAFSKQRPAAGSKTPGPRADTSEAIEPSGPLERLQCGPYRCFRYPSAQMAFRHLLSTHRPEVVGIGEAHALAGTEGIASSTRRFTEKLLPDVRPRPTDVIVELLAPNSSCTETTERAAEEQAPVTTGQASTNQNEFVTLGTRARELGVVPHLLRPSCDDLDAIQAAGDDAVFVSLETIARLTGDLVEQLLEKRPRPGFLFTYGGALHNDIAPREGREPWSFGPRLEQAADGRYLEIDLIVPEYVQDTPAWRGFSWWGHIPPPEPNRALVVEISSKSYVLFFPPTRRD